MTAMKPSAARAYRRTLLNPWLLSTHTVTAATISRHSSQMMASGWHSSLWAMI